MTRSSLGYSFGVTCGEPVELWRAGSDIGQLQHATLALELRLARGIRHHKQERRRERERERETREKEREKPERDGKGERERDKWGGRHFAASEI
jgi:hypothetical protein